MPDKVPANEEDYEAALGLAWLSSHGCSAVLRLVSRHGVGRLWSASVGQLVGWGLSLEAAHRFAERRATFCFAEAQAYLASHDTWFVGYGSAAYPRELAQLAQPPVGLFVRGARARFDHMLQAPRVTIVGTRRATSYGARAVDLVAGAFAERGVVVTSGMALGIDGRAHAAALDAGGVTVAVLGSGPDVVYPMRHRFLYERIVEEGVVLSELPPGTRPARWTFPARNRLLAALGDAVVVVEGSRTSGALQTAGAALELGRVIFAVPGQITADGHQGCNWLLYDGAIPVVDPCVAVEEFLQKTRIERQGRSCTAAEPVTIGSCECAPATSLYDSILRVLTAGVQSVDGVADLTGLEVKQVVVALTRLEMDGRVVRSGGGRFARAP
jgi:DNA processing protein